MTEDCACPVAGPCVGRSAQAAGRVVTPACRVPIILFVLYACRQPAANPQGFPAGSQL